MTKKPNFAKFMLGIAVLALLFVGTWAATTTPTTSATKSGLKTPPSPNQPSVVSRHAPLAPAAGDDSIFDVFELEGDVPDTAPNGVPDDWGSVNCGGGNAVVSTGVLFDGLGNSIYTGGGSKDHEAISAWKHKNGSVPDKDEILNAYAAKYLGLVEGDDLLIFGADRYANNGTAFIGIWFFQQPVFAAADGRFRQGPAATDALAEHENGDVLVLVEFTGGGTVPTAKVFEWVGTGGSESGGTLNDVTGTQTNPNAVRSISNAVAQTVSGSCTDWVHTPKSGPANTIQVNDFFEGGINLDAFPSLTGTCFSSFLVETRSSAVVTATLKDFTLGQFNTCVEIGLTKEADDTVICEGTPTEFTYTVNNPTANTVSITLVDDNATPADPTDDFDVIANCAAYNLNGNGVLTPADIGAGDTTYTCTRTLPIGVNQKNTATVTASFGGNTDTASAFEEVTVSEPPIANAGDDQSVCLNSGFGTTDFNLDGTVTNGTASWSFTSNTAGCSFVNPPGSGTEDPTVRCTGFGSATVKLTATSDAPAGTECPADDDEVVLTIKPNATAAAGDDEAVCVDDTFTSTSFELSGSVTDATPSWAIVGTNSASCTIDAGEENTATPSVTCTAIGTATVQLTAVSDNGCSNAVDELVLTVNANPEADAGADQIVCAAGVTTPFTLAGTADHGTAEWSCISGDCDKVAIADPSSLTSGVTFTGTGSATLQLTTTAGSGCGPAMSEVVLTVDPNPVVTICGDEACSSDELLLLTANITPGSGTITYKWTGPAGGISGPDDGPSVSVVLPGDYTVEVTRKATPDSPACPDSETIHVGLCPGGVCSP